MRYKGAFYGEDGSLILFDCRIGGLKIIKNKEMEGYILQNAAFSRLHKVILHSGSTKPRLVTERTECELRLSIMNNNI
jgi:hypothetical protein